MPAKRKSPKVVKCSELLCEFCGNGSRGEHPWCEASAFTRRACPATLRRRVAKLERIIRYQAQVPSDCTKTLLAEARRIGRGTKREEE